ncbi:MAG: Fic family protein [Pseudomonadales bacterium]|nr:Fic family protein [Pseudomonadales bacterium]MCP5329553.1 Fic family protein [Pseudomonadales bacterium]MCP5343908.1 Fic family protein [Pseudomonadales bacterium]
MATPSEKLAASLAELKRLQDKGQTAIQSSELGRTHRERLSKHGFIQEVMRGWYIPARPDETTGESTVWYASFWKFCAKYLDTRMGAQWCLSPEQSLSLHAENWTVPKQMFVRAPTGRNQITQLPFGTSLFEVRSSLPEAQETILKDGLRLFTLPAALVAASPAFFTSNPTDARAALAMVRDASDVLAKLLAGGHSVVAGRLAGAFRNIGRTGSADEILHTMKAAGYDVRENDPFAAASPVLFRNREPSPYVNRLRLMWQSMRQPVLEHFPKAPDIGSTQSAAEYLKQLEEIYTTDAYHSLSIEGYKVTPELIERVQQGSWNPDNNATDREQVSALAARGYWQAFQKVKSSIEKILAGANAGEVIRADHRDWYREMFAPSVTAGILKASDLAGYRNMDVFIRRSMHVPLKPDAVRDAMPALMDMLQEEKEAAVRVVLGHFMFVYIHPYMDGNGRMGRFLMNTMMASGGYPWLVVPVEQRIAYMEAASVGGDIVPFTKFLAGKARLS